MIKPEQRIFQSTLPAWGATNIIISDRDCSNISIHAPRMGSDRSAGSTLRPTLYFNPRSPHGERQAKERRYKDLPYFNPRSPHGERHYWGTKTSVTNHFNPRSPHGERLGYYAFWLFRHISIHAPRMGSDFCFLGFLVLLWNFNPRSPHGERHAPETGLVICTTFQSTLPAWGATCSRNRISHMHNISIHAPRMGSDRNS